MRTAIAVVIAVFVSLLGLNGVGHAQTLAEVQGTLEAIDCENGTVTTLDSSGNTETIYASDSTEVAVESSSVDFCSLDGYVGAPVDVWVVPYENEFVADQIDVTGPVPVLAATQTAVAPMPIVGTVLGTILVAGLLYLIAHDSGGAYYRYPYYGAYYHHYYGARYRPYLGWYPASAPVVYVAPPIYGTVLGIVTVNNYQFLAVRDHDGGYRRYPYFGPYRSYYYHPTYQYYSGTYVNVYTRAPVVVGDAHWDAPQYRMQRIERTVMSRPNPWSAPHRALPANYERPQWQPEAQRVFQSPAPAPRIEQVRPTYQQPQWQPQPQHQVQQPAQRPQLQQPQAQPQPVQRPQWQQQTQPAYQRPQPQPQQAQPRYQRPQPQPTQPSYQRPQWQQQPQAQPQPVQRPQQTQPTYQRPQPQPQQSQPTYQRPQPQPQQAQPRYQRPQPQPAQPTYHPQWPPQQQPQAQPQPVQRPQQTQPTYQRPQPQQSQPTYQRPEQQVQPQRGNSGSQGHSSQKPQQCDPRSNQGCDQPQR